MNKSDERKIYHNAHDKKVFQNWIEMIKIIWKTKLYKWKQIYTFIDGLNEQMRWSSNNITKPITKMKR